MNRTRAKKAVRGARLLKRFGPDAACAWCGESRLHLLLEFHHPAGRAHDPDLTIILCRNCHAIASEGQHCGAVPMKAQADILARQIARHRALAAFYRDAADSEERAAEDLRDFADSLDAKHSNFNECRRKRR